MLLASQVAGALAAGIFIWLLARRCGLRGGTAASTVVVVAIAVGAVLAAPNLRNAIAQLVDQHEFNDTVSSEEGELLPGTAIKADSEFLEWTAERIAPGESFQLIVGHIGRNPLLSQWALWLLEPRVGIQQAAPGDWVVMYDVVPDRYSGPAYDDVEVYRPGFAIARYVGAG